MSLSAETFKEVFRHHAAGVSVITVFDETRKPFGFTASSLASLSADPGYATANLAANTSTSQVIRIGSEVAIHTLANQALPLAKELSGPRELRFQSKGWDFSGNAPEHASASAILRGTVEQIIPVAGSLIIVIRAEDAQLNVFPERPLIYFNREFI